MNKTWWFKPEESQCSGGWAEQQAQIALQGREWPEHLDVLLKEQTQAVEELTSALNRRAAELHSARQTPTGEAAVQATQRRITAFIKDSDEFEARREFNNWFVSSGVVLAIWMNNGTAEVGRGEVQIERRKKTLLSLSLWKNRLRPVVRLTNILSNWANRSQNATPTLQSNAKR